MSVIVVLHFCEPLQSS